MDTSQFNILGSSSTLPIIPSTQPQATLPISPAPQPQLASSPAAIPSGLFQSPPYNYKNDLQTFAQRLNIQIPVYVTINQGLQHDPKFRSTVFVDGTSYTSPNTFSRHKPAEQDVAKVALENLSVKFRDEGCPVILENIPFYKSIMNEYATELKVEKPTYKTVPVKAMVPVFISCLTFEGIMYTGEHARSIKDAEQLAARAAIISIIGGSTSGILYELIKSKYNLFGSIRSSKSQCNDAINASLATMANAEHTIVSLDHKDKKVAIPVATNYNKTRIAVPASSTMLSLNPKSQMLKHVPSLKVIVSKHPNLNLHLGSEQSGDGLGKLPIDNGSSELPIGDGSGSKKRRNNKSKAKKKARLELNDEGLTSK